MAKVMSRDSVHKFMRMRTIKSRTCIQYSTTSYCKGVNYKQLFIVGVHSIRYRFRDLQILRKPPLEHSRRDPLTQPPWWETLDSYPSDLDIHRI